MKKTFITLLFLSIILSITNVYAQYTNAVVTTTPTFVYVGSLNRTIADNSNFQKIEVEVFGGGWSSESLGKTIYSIGNRGGLAIRQVTLGSGNENLYSLVAYTSGSTTNFYLKTYSYTSFSVRSVFLDGTPTSPTITNVAMTSSTSTPSGTSLSLNVVPVLYTDANGNLSINATDSKGYKLAVNGSAVATSMTVKLQSNWPDYVFEEDYKPRSLQELEQYIKINKHLPEIPKAIEVEQEGINLGEMNTKLLKKIEELTLHIIQMDKDIKILKEEKDNDKLTRSL